MIYWVQNQSLIIQQVLVTDNLPGITDYLLGITPSTGDLSGAMSSTDDPPDTEPIMITDDLAGKN